MVKTSTALNALGENLKYLQRCEGETRRSFATKLGYDRLSYGKLLWGQQNMKLQTAEKIAAKTGYALSALLDTSFADDADYRNQCHYKEIDTLAVFLYSVQYQMNIQSLTLSDISSTLNMDKAELSRILTGQIKNPTIETLDRIATGVNCRLSELLREESK